MFQFKHNFKVMIIVIIININNNLVFHFQKIEKSSVVMMDRWHIEVSEQTSTQETEEAGDKIPYNIVNNYFSIGVVSVGRLFRVARFAIY